MSITVWFANAPPGWDKPLTFERALDVRVMMRKLGPAFLARHAGLHRELLEAWWTIAKQERERA